MKKTNLLFVLALVGLVSCGTPSNPSANASEESTQQESGSDSSATHEHIDYYLKAEDRLVQDYQGKSFWTDGIEKVELKTCIDGDTAHFTTSTGETLKSRFFGIDTPESTGAVQEWGHAASEFTKSKLKEASENGTIVISSPFDDYKAPEADSTGSRYVSLVWVNTTTKNAGFKDLVLLNLWIVQEGLSTVKNVSDMPRMIDDFYAAEAQAKAEKLKMHSGEADPDYNYGSYETTSLLDMKKEIEATLKDSTHENVYNGKKVKIVGTVAGYSNNTLYVENYYTKEQGGRYEYGEYAGINIFTGMSAISSKYTKTNTYIQVCGLAQESENFGFQLTDAQFKPYPTADDEKNARVLISADDNTEELALHTFEKTAAGIGSTDYEILNCSVRLTDTVKVTGGYKSEDGEFTLYVSDENGTELNYDIFIPFVFHPAENQSVTYSEVTDFQGKSFKVEGVYTFHKFSSGRIGYQITPNNSTGFVEVTE